MNCEKCGKTLATGVTTCEYCGHPVSSAEGNPAVKAKKENVVTGIVGALIGAAIGGGSIILLSQLGYIASVSGLILAVCTLKGYELLGGGMSVKGIVISILMVLATPYLADRIDWAILVAQEFEVTFGEAFAAIPLLIEDEIIEFGTYIKNLLMIYGFAALGAFTTLKNAFKK